MLTIWGRANSTNVKKALWCAEEVGVAFERIDAGGAFGGLNDPAYRAMNPNGLVPCLKDGDLVMWESNAVVRYLAARYAPGTLYPEDPAARAMGDKWMDWALFYLPEPNRALLYNLLRRGPAERDMEEAARGHKAMAEAFAIADAALAHQPYFSGESFGMGDIPIGCFAYNWLNLDIERPAAPRLEAWYKKLTERPAFARWVMIPLT